MGRYSLQMFDHSGNYQPSLGGIPIPGDAVGVHGVSYNPTGSVMDKIGTLQCAVELVDYRNLALRAGTSLQLRDNDLGVIVAQTASITAKNVKVAASGHSAQITAPDLLDELRRTSVSFATAQGETVRTTLQRLVGLRTETVWGFTTDLDSSLDGIDFSAPGVSVAQAAAKFATERFAHFWRGSANGGRTLAFGRGGQSSGIRLAQAAPNPTRARAANPAIRQIVEGGLEIDEVGTIVNTLIPTGGGNGVAQLTLRPLYNYTGETSLGHGVFQSGPSPFNGFDASRPIRRRPVQDGGQTSVDGMEYFIQDDLSINGDGTAANPGYGAWEDHWSQQQIAPILNGSTVDLTNAAAALYQATVAHLKANSAPHTEYRITTDGAGDLRNLAATTVQVVYRGVARRRVGANAQEFVAVDLNLPLTVLEIMVSEADDESLTAVWTVSDNGQYAASTSSIVIAGLDQVSYGHFTAQTGVGFPALPFDDFIDNGAVGPISRNFPGNGGTVQVVQAVLSLYIVPARAPVVPAAHGHDVATAAMNSDVNAIPHDVNALASAEYEVGGAAPANGPVVYSPSVKFDINPNPPAGTVAVTYDPVGRFFYYGGTNHGQQLVDIPSEPLTITQINPTANGTGGTVKATTGAADIAAGKANPGTVGGTVATATHPYTEPATGAKTGALSTAAGKVSQAIGWGVQSNPAPLPSVKVMIGGATVGTVTNAGRLDCTAAVIAAGSGRTDFVVTLSVAAAPGGNPTGLCRVYGLLQLRTINSSLNAPI